MTPFSSVVAAPTPALPASIRPTRRLRNASVATSISKAAKVRPRMLSLFRKPRLSIRPLVLPDDVVLFLFRKALLRSSKGIRLANVLRWVLRLLPLLLRPRLLANRLPHCQSIARRQVRLSLASMSCPLHPFPLPSFLACSSTLLTPC